MRTAPTIPRPGRRWPNASYHGRYGFRQRLPGRVPLHGSQAGRFPSPAPRRGKRCCIITDVMRYNAAEVPTKMGTFSQYQYPHALAALCGDCADYCGIQGKNDDEKSSKTSLPGHGGPEGEGRHQEDHQGLRRGREVLPGYPGRDGRDRPSTTSAPAPTPATR